MAGCRSNADDHQGATEAIRKVEELFTVDTAKLKAITEHFISELAKGRSSAPDYATDG